MSYQIQNIALGLRPSYAPSVYIKDETFVSETNERFLSSNRAYDEVDLSSLNLFCVNLPEEELLKLYFDNMVVALRQRHNCRTCIKALTELGTLVTINPDGSLTSVLRPVLALDTAKDEEDYWGLMAIAEAAESKDVIDHVVYNMDMIKALPQSRNGYGHIGVNYEKHRGTLPENRGKALDLFNKLSAALQRSVTEISFDKYKAFSEQFNNSNDTNLLKKWVDIYNQFFAVIKDIVETKNQKLRKHKIYRYAALGNISVHGLYNTVLGEFVRSALLEKSFDVARMAFLAQVDPEQYRRSTREASKGLILAADKIFTEKNYYSSIDHTYCNSDDLKNPDLFGKLYWEATPTPEVIKRSKRFTDMLAERDSELYKLERDAAGTVVETDMPGFIEFIRETNPLRIQVMLDVYETASSFVTYFKPADMNSPNINACYPNKGTRVIPAIIKSNGVHYTRVNQYMNFELFTLSGYVDVKAMMRSTDTAFTEHLTKGQTQQVVFAIDAEVKREVGCPNPAFPAALISEMHPFRAVIEEYNRANTVSTVVGETTLHGLVFTRGASFRGTRFLVSYADGAETKTREILVNGWSEPLIAKEEGQILS